MSPTARVRVGVCGLGLIGGSALLGLRAAGMDVRGCDPHPAARAWCTDLGVPVDPEVAVTARAVDVLLVCVPPHATAAVVAAALGASEDLVVLDAASVKGPVVDEVRRRTPEAAGRFLPAHPLAGAERAGHGAAREDLLCDVPWALCPPADDPEGEADALEALLRAAPLLEALRAHVVVCTAVEHDAAV
ncbi:prephenate dehydrogenase/arogenate dehydrogenase family protein, partial [Patulibacter sp. S7RM1-6]